MAERKKQIQLSIIEESRKTRIRYDKMQGRPSVTIKIRDKKYECLLDTGARINVVRVVTLCKYLNLKLTKILTYVRVL